MPDAVPNGGGGNDFVQQLRELAPDLWEAGRIVLEPPLSDEAALIAAYRELDVFCYPTEAASGEANPVAVSEAMATGLPVVATTLDCFHGQLEHGSNALLIPPGNADALADTLETLVRDAALRTRLGSAGRERVSELDDERIATVVTELFAPDDVLRP